LHPDDRGFVAISDVRMPNTGRKRSRYRSRR
jgi:hypothetical protein